MGLCPFHDDKSPSLVISPKKNVWHCLGACQAGGSVIDWVMKAERVSFRRAVEMLRTGAPSLVAQDSPPSDRKPLDDLADPDEPDQVVLRRVVDFYHATLKESPAALGYLERRGLQHGEMIQHFKLGYANRTLGYRLPAKTVKAGEAVRAQLQRVGVYRDSGHEHFAGSVVIPVFGEDGAVLEMYGRKIADFIRKGTPAHLYLPARSDRRRGVFNIEVMKASKEIILCEAVFDALTFWCAGLRNVTCAYGVDGFTDEIRDALIEHSIKKVLIAYDRDEAGDRAAERLAPELAKEGIEVFRVLFPRDMDANDYAYKVRPAAKSLETALRGAVWMAGTRPVAVPDELVEVRASASPSTPQTPVDTAEVMTPGPPVVAHAQPVTATEAAPAPELETLPMMTPPPAGTMPAPATVEPDLRTTAAPQTGAATAGPAAPSLVASGATPETPPPAVPSIEAEVQDDEVRIRLGAGGSAGSAGTRATSPSA